MRIEFVMIAFGLAGGCGGAVARRLLARLRRGALIRAGCCEAALALLWALAGWGWAVGLLPGAGMPLLLGLAWLGVAAGSVDLRHRRLPDALTLPAVPGGLALLAPLGSGAVVRGLAGTVLALAAYAAVHRLRPAALGMGDVKLAGSVGGALAGVSWPALALATVLAAALSAVLALLTRQLVVAHGPPLLGAAWLVAAGLLGVGAPVRAVAGW